MLKVSRILHAGYVFECEGMRIAFDPIFENPFSRNCHAFPDVRFDLEQIRQLRFEAVFLSHFHDDHCSLESLNLLDRETPIYLYCVFDELFDWIRELGFRNVHPLYLNEKIHVGPFEVTPHPALDIDVDSIFQVKAGGTQVLNVVDSWIDERTLEKLAKLGPWDLVLWPFQTMRELEVIAPSMARPATGLIPEEWVPQLKALAPKALVPSSCQFIQEPWSWQRKAYFPISYRSFQNQIERILPQTEILRLDPSESLILEKGSRKRGESLSWIHKREGTVDYEYDPDALPTPTSDIATHFPALNAHQESRILRYCREELLREYEALPEGDGEFFSQERIWQLSLFDHEGAERAFYYRLLKTKIELLPKKPSQISWQTEVSIFKLFSALECGEAMSSMYLRVDNQGLGGDVMEDPLIRCLFTGVFGAYQKDQLKRL